MQHRLELTHDSFKLGWNLKRKCNSDLPNWLLLLKNSSYKFKLLDNSCRRGNILWKNVFLNVFPFNCAFKKHLLQKILSKEFCNLNNRYNQNELAFHWNTEKRTTSKIIIRVSLARIILNKLILSKYRIHKYGIENCFGGNELNTGS